LRNPYELQKTIASDLERMRDVIYWAFFMTAFWFWGVYNIVKQIVSKADKTSIQYMKPGDAEQGVAPEPRGQVS
jgi:hypothetical protein